MIKGLFKSMFAARIPVEQKKEEFTPTNAYALGKIAEIMDSPITAIKGEPSRRFVHKMIHEETLPAHIVDMKMDFHEVDNVKVTAATFRTVMYNQINTIAKYIETCTVQVENFEGRKVRDLESYICGDDNDGLKIQIWGSVEESDHEYRRRIETVKEYQRHDQQKMKILISQYPEEAKNIIEEMKST